MDKPLKRKNNSGKIVKRSKHKKYEKVIEWKILRQDLEKECGFFRSENLLKNYWYPHLRTKEEEDDDDDLEVIQEDIEENENMVVSSPFEDSMVSNNVLNHITCTTTMSPPHSASRSFSLPPISSILNSPPQPQRSHTLPSISGRFFYDDLTQSRTLPPISFILNNPPQSSSTSFISNEPSCFCDYSTQDRPRLPPLSSVLDRSLYDSSAYQQQNRYLGPLHR
jgi:hypothetical protein